METNGTSALATYEQPRMTLIPTEQTSNSAMALAKLAAVSGLCKTQKAADAFFVVMYGYEIGIPAMTALRTIHVIGNTPVCSGEALLAIIRRSGKVDIKIEGDDKQATVWMKRRDSGEEYTARWNIERGRKAGLIKTAGNWEKHPQAMMQWRGVSECSKFLCSDITNGLYLIEEIAPDTMVNEDGEAVGDIIISKPEPVITPVIEAPAKKTARCLASDADCRGQFAVLCKQLDITNDEPYLKQLNIEKYSEYDGTFDELCQKMRDLHEWFVNEGHRVGENPDGEPDLVEQAAAEIPLEQAKASLNHQTGSSTRKQPEPVIEAPEAVKLVEGGAVAGASPFDMNAPQVNPDTGVLEHVNGKADYVQPPF